jgi:hypothetical protein
MTERSSFEQMMAKAEDIISRYRNTLRVLACEGAVAASNTSPKGAES